jgi:LPS O-antigen subunit length determinant protein (WzzB/FepE family)
MDSPEDKNENDKVYLVSSPVDLSPTIDLRRWLVQFWRGKWIILATSVVGVVLGFASSYIFDPVYRSETTISPVTDDNCSGLAALAVNSADYPWRA